VADRANHGEKLDTSPVHGILIDGSQWPHTAPRQAALLHPWSSIRGGPSSPFVDNSLISGSSKLG
jgi:hypothetical protein